MTRPARPAQPADPARSAGRQRQRGVRRRTPDSARRDSARRDSARRDSARRDSARRRAPGELPHWMGPALLSAALVVLVFVAFWPALSAQFVNMDDDLYVYNNPYISRGLSGASIAWAWRSHYLGYQIPMVWMSLMLDTDLFGTGPGGYHLTNVLLHAGGAVLLMLGLRRATGSTWRAALAAALWAVHPLRVESVAWVTERKDVLAGFFGFAAIYAYTRYATAEGPGPGPAGLGAAGGGRTFGRAWYGLVVVAYCLSLLSKPQFIMALPAILWLLDYWPLGRMSRGASGGAAGSAAADGPRASPWVLALEKWPLVLATAVDAAAMLYSEVSEGPIRGDVTFGTGARLANAVISPAKCLGKLFEFGRLAPFYPLPPQWSGAAVAGSAALLLAVTALALRQRRRRPWLAVGWFWFLTALAPAVTPPPGFLAVSTADRFTYFPAAGLALMVVWSIPAARARGGRVGLAAAAGACLAVLVGFSRVQTGYWHDSVTLFRHTTSVVDRAWLAHHDLAVALSDRGENAAALEQFERCLAINPNYPRGWMNEGILLNRMGPAYAAKALACAEAAIHLQPDAPAPHVTRAVALEALNRQAEVVSECETALRLDPQSALAHDYLGLALAKLGRRDEALSHFQAALQLDPDDSLAQHNLARALRQPATKPEAGR